MTLKLLVAKIFTSLAVAGIVLFANIGRADEVKNQDAKIKSAMEVLKSSAEKLGPAKINGKDSVAGKEVPAIYFGQAKQNNDFTLVDETVKKAGARPRFLSRTVMSLSACQRTSKRTMEVAPSAQSLIPKGRQSRLFKRAKLSMAMSIFSASPIQRDTSQFATNPRPLLESITWAI